MLNNTIITTQRTQKITYTFNQHLNKTNQTIKINKKHTNYEPTSMEPK